MEYGLGRIVGVGFFGGFELVEEEDVVYNALFVGGGFTGGMGAG